MFQRPIASAAACLFTLAALASTPALAQQAFSAMAPPAAKPLHVEAFLGKGQSAARVELPAADPARAKSLRERNSSAWDKRLEIGFGRSLDGLPGAGSESLRWERVAGGAAARWEVASPGAKAVRIALEASALPPGAQLRFAGSADPATVYGPFAAEEVSTAREYWSPVLEGERGIVEIFVPRGGEAGGVRAGLRWVSHLLESPRSADPEKALKASGACEVDLICLSASNSVLADTGRSVARMTFTVSGGGTALCTGTLLATASGPGAPYFYSANHCISDQPTASTLTTHWFYDRTACGGGVQNPGYVQLPGGAALLYNDATTDVLLLRLNATPPGGAIYSGWNAAALANGTPLIAVHHPAGDYKKVSLGSSGGFSAYGGGTGSTHIVSLWNSTATGVTEGGSSGSGIFTAVGSPATSYQLRGGLHGGPSSCSATGVDLRDYYSRFDNAYPFMSQYLAPGSGARLTNISTRMQVLTGNDVMIGGFVIGGSSNKTVAIVATGPSLTNFGISNPLANPTLTLVRSSDQAVLATNDNWQSAGNASQLQSAGFAPSNPLEAAILVNLAPGAYTAIVQGVGGGTGVSVIGVYEVDGPQIPLVNISTRGRVLTGNDVMIGGFVISGTGPQTLAIVATGPSLANFGIASPLADPTITLVRSSDQAVIDSNDDWQSHANASQLQSAGFAPPNPLEAGIYTTLQPGAYTAIVSGVGGGTGVAVIGVYKVN